jgi:hypothetical protein
VVDPDIGMTRLRWLATGPVEASPAAVKAEVEKLEFLRGLGADTLDMSVPPAERRRFLASVGRRLTGQALERREPQRRYPILLTVLSQSATDVLDEVVQLFDQAVSSRESKAAYKMREALADRGKSGEDRQALLDDMLAIIFDTGIDDEKIGGLIRGERIGWTRLRAAKATAKPRLETVEGGTQVVDLILADRGGLGQVPAQSAGEVLDFGVAPAHGCGALSAAEQLVDHRVELVFLRALMREKMVVDRLTGLPYGLLGGVTPSEIASAACRTACRTGCSLWCSAENRWSRLSVRGPG